MANRPDSNRALSTKTKLVLILIMFVVINLIFYFGFDSSDESEKKIEFDDQNPLYTEENSDLKQEIQNLLTP